MKSVEKVYKNKIFIGICLAILAAVLLIFVWTGRDYGKQAMNAFYLSAQFEGEYKIAEGEWQPYVKGVHIPADKGDVTLKGNFQLCVPDTGEVIGKAEEGVVLAFYFNHIGGEISENGVDFYPFDAELEVAGEDMCGKLYIGYECSGADEVIIRLKNPHKFGNTGAVDDFLNSLNTYGGTDFERDIINSGSTQRIFGIALILFAFMVLGTAIFSTLINVKTTGNLWLVGLGIFFPGIYFIFKADGVMFFSEIIKFNTRMLAGAMMLYMLTMTVSVALWLQDKAKKVGAYVTALALTSVCAFMLTPCFADVKLYDMLPLWTVIQGAICLVMTVLLVKRFNGGSKNEKILNGLAMLPMIAFITDSTATAFSIWQGGILSEIVFILMFLVSLILLLKVVPQNMNAAIRAKEL
ncbi:MAG: hypothetical protein IKV63_03760, partial [Clostridia bacterium]|nr:hypothetical protein [Clostridia bacterium]